MAETKVPVRQEKSGPSSTLQAWQPFESLRQEIDRLFDDFGWGSWQPFRRSLFAGEPLFRRALTRAAMLPGMDEKNIEVKVADGRLTIKGEKQEEKEEKEKDYYLQERHYGSFERTFDLPETVEPDKIEASFKKGVLTVTLSKKVGAQKPEKKIEVKAV